jgi:hypothetical protein
MTAQQLSNFTRYISCMYPELAREAIENTTPRLYDLTLLQPIYDRFVQEYGHPEYRWKKRDKGDLKMLFVMIATYLYHPASLKANAVLSKNGFVLKMTEVLKLSNNTLVSFLLNRARGCVKNPAYYGKVNEFCEKLREEGLI